MYVFVLTCFKFNYLQRVSPNYVSINWESANRVSLLGVGELDGASKLENHRCIQFSLGTYEMYRITIS